MISASVVKELTQIITRLGYEKMLLYVLHLQSYVFEISYKKY